MAEEAPRRVRVTTETDEAIRDVGYVMGCFLKFLALVFVGFLTWEVPLVMLPVIAVVCLVMAVVRWHRQK